MYNLISVPLDTTPDGRRALPLAVDIARRAGAEIELVHVVAPPVVGPDRWGPMAPTLAEWQELQHAADTQLADIAAAVMRAGVVTRPVVRIVDGGISKSLADHLRESKSDLVVMNARDLKRVDRLLLGSVSESVMRHGGVPTLFIHQGYTDLDYWLVLQRSDECWCRSTAPRSASACWSTRPPLLTSLAPI